MTDFARAVFSKLMLASMLGILFALALPGSLYSQDNAVPDDFEVVYISSPALVVQDIDRETLTISANGKVSLSKVARYTGTFPDFVREELPEQTITISSGALDQIYAAITENDFFGLEARYNDPAIIDGDWAELRVTANGQSHTVRTRNIKVRAFDRITMTINGVLPEQRRLLYNAINGADYEEVER